ncbi:MAG TPA: cupin domain-containing protein [Hyphomicrobiales bacterium]|nr:cupin domain-containing protein [Hyphomicrobiales bacterium]
MAKDSEPLAFRFTDDGSIPNNSRLPVLIYRAAFDASVNDPPAEAESLLRKNRWLPQWRNGIYDFHHYHSTAHEALAIVRGDVKVKLGGEAGQDFDLAAGDVAVLPAGTGHKRVSGAGRFLVVGAYPPGQDWDLLRGEPGERPAALRNIERVPLPNSDPVFGGDGPLTRLWR